MHFADAVTVTPVYSPADMGSQLLAFAPTLGLYIGGGLVLGLAILLAVWGIKLAIRTAKTVGK